jgi:hypothetical protein
MKFPTVHEDTDFNACSFVQDFPGAGDNRSSCSRPAIGHVGCGHAISERTAKSVKVIYGCSGNFFQQIQNGAPFESFNPIA